MVEFRIELSGSGEGDVDKIKAHFEQTVTKFRKAGLDVNGYVNAHEVGKGKGAHTAINVNAGDIAWPAAKKAAAEAASSTAAAAVVPGG